MTSATVISRRRRLFSLDKLFPFIGKPLVIKIDVDGYELPVLEGAKKLPRQNYGYAQIKSRGQSRSFSYRQELGVTLHFRSATLRCTRIFSVSTKS